MIDGPWAALAALASGVNRGFQVKSQQDQDAQRQQASDAAEEERQRQLRERLATRQALHDQMFGTDENGAPKPPPISRGQLPWGQQDDSGPSDTPPPVPGPMRPAFNPDVDYGSLLKAKDDQARVDNTVANTGYMNDYHKGQLRIQGQNADTAGLVGGARANNLNANTNLIDAKTPDGDQARAWLKQHGKPSDGLSDQQASDAVASYAKMPKPVGTGRSGSTMTPDLRNAQQSRLAMTALSGMVPKDKAGVSWRQWGADPNNPSADPNAIAGATADSTAKAGRSQAATRNFIDLENKLTQPLPAIPGGNAPSGAPPVVKPAMTGSLSDLTHASGGVDPITSANRTAKAQAALSDPTAPAAVKKAAQAWLAAHTGA